MCAVSENKLDVIAASALRGSEPHHKGEAVQADVGSDAGDLEWLRYRTRWSHH